MDGKASLAIDDLTIGLRLGLINRAVTPIGTRYQYQSVAIKAGQILIVPLNAGYQAIPLITLSATLNGGSPGYVESHARLAITRAAGVLDGE